MTQSSDFRVDIEEAVKALSLSTDTFKLVSLHEYQSILVSILEQFTTLGKKGLNASWRWGVLKEPHASIHVFYPSSVYKNLYHLKRGFGLLLKTGEERNKTATSGFMRGQLQRSPNY